MGPGSAAHRQEDAALRPGHETARRHDPFSRHASAFSRPISPELCSHLRTLLKQGRREGRAPAGTRVPCAKKTRTGWTTGDAGTPGLPCANGFTAYVALSPGSDALLPSSPCGSLMCGPGWTTHITTRLDAQTPGVRTTRFCRPRASPLRAPMTSVRSPSKPNEDAVSAVSCRARPAHGTPLKEFHPAV
jgi:hypothetical protein